MAPNVNTRKERGDLAWAKGRKITGGVRRGGGGTKRCTAKGGGLWVGKESKGLGESRAERGAKRGVTMNIQKNGKKVLKVTDKQIYNSGGKGDLKREGRVKVG